ncbi:hypothetical protein CALCODRAFT_489134, partial [Calocera cornea HHB12733]
MPNISMHSRKLNSLFAFTAIGATEGFMRNLQAPSNVVLTGRTYHRMLDVADPTHSIHWFLYDSQERALAGRQRQVPPAFLPLVSNALERVNPYLHALAQFQDDEVPDTAVLELPEHAASGDFAAIMHSNNSTIVSPRSILIWRLGDVQPSFISLFSRHYEPLQYPLLFPHGTPGWGLLEEEQWQPGPRGQYPHYLTQLKWYRLCLLREERFLRFGRLTNEYLCDMYSRVQEQDLDYIRRAREHQAAARAGPDGMEQEAVDIELPASFTGSRRWASEQTADSLTLARKDGKASIFTTITCNPNWPEIVSILHPGQTASDVPMVVARVFKLRLQHFHYLLRKHLGKLVYIVQVIEFQKRGLPHAHIVLKVHPELPPDQ